MQGNERFELLQVIQQTLYGRAYLANDTVTGQKVVVKVSYTKLMNSRKSLSGRTMLENPREECKVMRKIGGKHHVLSLVAELEDEHFHWMAVPFCSEGDFYDLVTAQNGFSPRRAKRFFLQLARGVSHIHKQGYAHLDLSLENLLCDHKNNLAICDFGLVQKLPKPGCHVQLGEFRPGKLKYMAPELVHDNKMFPRKADVYSMGIILFMMLVGRPLYRNPKLDDENFADLMKCGIGAVLRRTQRLIPPDAVTLMEGMLQPNPKKRLTLSQVLRSKWLSDRPS